MDFKNQLKKDLDTFFNFDEFAEEHIVNKRKLNIIIDNETLKERTRKEYEGIFVGEILYFVKAKDYGLPPKEEELHLLDGRQYKVFDINIENGVYEIILQSARS